MGHPKYWPTWLGLALLRGLRWLPASVRRVLANAAGGMLHRLLKERRQIALSNVRACSEALEVADPGALVRQHFTALAQSLLDIGDAWWAPDLRIERTSSLEGLEHLQQALEHGGVMLLAGHFTNLELGCRVVNGQQPLAPMYREHGNPVFERAVKRARLRFVPRVITKEETRAAIRWLRDGEVLWYASDQDPGAREHVFAPFLGIATATHVATMRLARLGRAQVVPMHQWRDEEGMFRVRLFPALENFPSGDDVADATAVNRAIERMVRLSPAEYLWIHRRFKTRPTVSHKDFYD